MKKKTSALFLLAPTLSVSLTLAACAPQQLSPAPEVSQAEALATEQVQFTYRVPEAFQTQLVQPDAVKYILLSLTGEGVDGTRVNSGGLVEIINNTATAVIPNVPLKPGSVRVVTAQGYDAEQNPLPAFVGKGYYISQANQAKVNVRVDRRGLLVGQILEYLIQNYPGKVQQISLNGLTQIVEQMTGFDAETETFTTEPTLFDPVGMAELLNTNPGATLQDLQNEVPATAGESTLGIQTKGGGIFTEALVLRINDPNSSEASIPVGTTSPHIPVLNDISQGTWTFTLMKQDGTVLGTTSMEVDANGNVALGSNPLTVQLQPEVTALSVNTLPLAGNVQTVLTGTGFTDASAVKFGTVDAVSFTVNSDTQITATAPAMTAGSVNVSVTTPGGSSTAAVGNQATYVNPPTLTGLTPSSGSIGDSITLTGTLFNATHTQNTVKFGTTTASTSAGSTTSLTVTVPDGLSGIVPVTVTTTQQTSSSLNFSVVPKVSALNINNGPNTGGTTVVLTGSGFTGATAVKFGTVNASSFTVNSNTQITATSAASSPGDVNITVTTLGGTSATGADNLFTYNPPAMSTVLAGSSQGFADGTGTAAQFSFPWGITRDSNNNLFTSDLFNHNVRKITLTGEVSIFAGSATQLAGSTNGTGTAASFSSPRFIARDSSNNLYVTDLGNYQVRKITAAGEVSLLAGSTFGDVNATGAAAKFGSLRGIALDQNNNVYVMDNGTRKIKKITPAGVVTTFAGSGGTGSTNGPANSATFSGDSRDLAVDSSNNVYLADAVNNCIRKVDALTQVVSTFAGTCGSAAGTNDGTGAAAQFNLPTGLTFDANGNLWVADLSSSKIRKITPAGVVSSIHSTGEPLSAPIDLVFDSDGNLYITGYNHKVIKWTL